MDAYATTSPPGVRVRLEPLAALGPAGAGGGTTSAPDPLLARTRPFGVEERDAGAGLVGDPCCRGRVEAGAQLRGRQLGLCPQGVGLAVTDALVQDQQHQQGEGEDRDAAAAARVRVRRDRRATRRIGAQSSVARFRR